MKKSTSLVGWKARGQGDIFCMPKDKMKIWRGISGTELYSACLEGTTSCATLSMLPFENDTAMP